MRLENAFDPTLNSMESYDVKLQPYVTGMYSAHLIKPNFSYKVTLLDIIFILFWQASHLVVTLAPHGYSGSPSKNHEDNAI